MNLILLLLDCKNIPSLNINLFISSLVRLKMPNERCRKYLSNSSDVSRILLTTNLRFFQEIDFVYPSVCTVSVRKNIHFRDVDSFLNPGGLAVV